MPDRDAIYDRYLDALLGGHAVAPEEFLAGEGASDDSELLGALRTMYQHRAATPPPRPPAPPTHPAPASTRPEARRIGDFTILRPIGRGGMGEVFLARQESLGREVALKLIRTDAAHSPGAAARFDREARAAARLRHPGIVQVHAIGEDRGVRFIAMELIDGRPLDALLEDAAGRPHRPPVERAIRWVIGVARALDYAHQHGIIHRDVKPSNILITPDDRPLLVDFGLARELDGPSVTLSEGFAGSPFYAAPEQIGRAGGLTDGRTDVYSLGVVLYQCLTGSLTVAPGTLEQVFQSILTDDAPSPRLRNPGVSRDLELVTLKAMEKDPARRYATAGAFASDLQAILDHRPVSVRPAGRLERLAKWSRRNPGVAAVVGAGGAALALIALILIGQKVAQSRERAHQAEAALTQAQALVSEFRSAFDRSRELERRHADAALYRGASYFTAERDRAVDDIEDQVMAARKQREHAQIRVLELCDRAERLGADPARASGVRGELYFHQVLAAEISGDAPGKALYRALTLANDPTGDLARRLRGETRLTVVCDPPGARLDLFRRTPETNLFDGGEPRIVNAPWRRVDDPALPGTWCLRVTKAAPGDSGSGPQPGDHILQLARRPIRGTVFVADLAPDGLAARAGVARLARAVQVDDQPMVDEWFVDAYADDPAPHTFIFESDGRLLSVGPAPLRDLGVALLGPVALAQRGGVPARLWRDGRLVDLDLPPGAQYQATAAPLLCGPASLLAPGSLTEAPVHTAPVNTAPLHTAPLHTALDAGDYILVASAPGRETVRRPFQATRDEGAALHISLQPIGATPDGWVRLPAPGPGQPGSFYMMEREVTVEEYFEFLADPATAAEIAASPTPIRFPRDGETARGERGPDGRFLLPQGWRWRWPVVFVSWEDAKAYAAWRTRRARDEGRHEVYDLPTAGEWQLVSAPAEGCAYVFGDRFRPKWVSSCFARPRPDPEPVLRFPIDESAFGVFDMAGSASEWTLTRWRPDQPHMHFVSGNWGTGEAREFTPYGGNGLLPDRVSGSIGFRLVMFRGPDAEARVKARAAQGRVQ